MSTIHVNRQKGHYAGSANAQHDAAVGRIDRFWANKRKAEEKAGRDAEQARAEAAHAAEAARFRAEHGLDDEDAPGINVVIAGSAQPVVVERPSRKARPQRSQLPRFLSETALDGYLAVDAAPAAEPTDAVDLAPVAEPVVEVVVEAVAAPVELPIVVEPEPVVVAPVRPEPPAPVMVAVHGSTARGGKYADQAPTPRKQSVTITGSALVSGPPTPKPAAVVAAPQPKSQRPLSADELRAQLGLRRR